MNKIFFLCICYEFLDSRFYEFCQSRSEKKKLDEELVELSNTVDELTSASGEAAVQRLQDEINDSKAILKCGVCLDRPKEVCSCILFFLPKWVIVSG